VSKGNSVGKSPSIRSNGNFSIHNHM
jgi:hypothetical protein